MCAPTTHKVKQKQQSMLVLIYLNWVDAAGDEVGVHTCFHLSDYDWALDLFVPHTAGGKGHPG